MTFDLHQILASKRAFRHALATRSIVEKLAFLDALRLRSLTLREAREGAASSKVLREEPPSYQAGTQSDPS